MPTFWKERMKAERNEILLPKSKEVSIIDKISLSNKEKS